MLRSDGKYDPLEASILDILHDYCRVPSFTNSSGEALVRTFFKQQLAAEPVAAEVTPDGGKANLIATRGSGPGGLVLAGHTPHGWGTPRFTDEVLAAGRAAFDQHTGGAAELDYLALTDPELGPAVPGPARLLIAARVGDTRLIDNTPVELAGFVGSVPEAAAAAAAREAGMPLGLYLDLAVGTDPAGAETWAEGGRAEGAPLPGLTAEEIARAFGLEKKTVQQWINAHDAYLNRPVR